MQIIIAEKPKVARKISQALGIHNYVKEGKAGYFKDNNRVVASAVGHLFGVAPANENKGYPIFDYVWKPLPEFQKGTGYVKPYINILKKLGKKAKEVVIATDYDVEGSLIGYNIIRFLTPKASVLRAKFSSLTHSELKKAFENLEEFDYSNAIAGETRHELDWLYGINLSRALMSALRKAGVWKILSIGRVQGPALHLAVEKDREIETFVPVPYWYVKALISGVWFKSGIFKDRKKAEELFKSLGKKITVIKVERREIKRIPIPPFDLTTLQMEAYRVFKFSPAKTLDLAQKLYEEGMISYPRTSSQKLPRSIGYRKIIEKLTKKFEEGEKVLKLEVLRPFEGKKEDPAHPAIYPTGEFSKSIGKDEMKLYNMIVKNFLSVFLGPARIEKTTVVLEHNLKAEGQKILEKGWLEVYDYVKVGELDLGLFEEGKTFTVEKAELKKEQTKPPSRYSTATLVKELEKRNLGTKATRAVIVETLFKRDYLEKPSSITVTAFGKAVHDTLEKYAPMILDEALTREFEEKIERLKNGSMEKDTIIEEAKSILEEVLYEFKKKEGEIGDFLKEELKALTKERAKMSCPNCGEPMIVKHHKGKRFLACTNYPKCKTSFPLPSQSRFWITKKTCVVCGKPLIKIRASRGGAFEVCIDPQCSSRKNKH